MWDYTGNRRKSRFRFMILVLFFTQIWKLKQKHLEKTGFLYKIWPWRVVLTYTIAFYIYQSTILSKKLNDEKKSTGRPLPYCELVLQRKLKWPMLFEKRGRESWVSRKVTSNFTQRWIARIHEGWAQICQHQTWKKNLPACRGPASGAVAPVTVASHMTWCCSDHSGRQS